MNIYWIFGRYFMSIFLVLSLDLSLFGSEVSDNMELPFCLDLTVGQFDS